MTGSERSILTALYAAPEKTASWLDLREASGCKTTRGFRRVTSRMIEGGWITCADKHGIDMTITFGGLQALRGGLK